MKLLLVVFLTTLPSCLWSDSYNPVSPEYPCGTRAHQCIDGACCWNNEVCGGIGTGCPEGYCCFVGKDMWLKRHQAK